MKPGFDFLKEQRSERIFSSMINCFASFNLALLTFSQVVIFANSFQSVTAFESKNFSAETSNEHSYIALRKTFLNSRSEEHLNCAAFLDGNSSALENYVKMGRMTINSTLPTDVTCSAIRSRIMGNNSYRPLERPIVTARNVYKDYELQEVMLSMGYHPQNWFCFAIDFEASESFKSQLRNLADCLDNVIVLKETYDFDSAGHNQDLAHFECLKKLRAKNWYHALLLQNGDIPLKTVEEFSSISKLLNVTSEMGFEFPILGGYNEAVDWSPRGLRMFKNGKKISEKILRKPLVIRKQLNQVFVSKTFIEGIFDNLNLARLLEIIDNKKFFGVDGMLIQMLFVNDLGLPGQMRSGCSGSYSDFVRLTFFNWKDGRDGINPFCKSQRKKHGICLLGVEYLPDLQSSPHLVANKVVSEFDFGTALCMSELLHNRSMTNSRIDLDVYKKSPMVREMEAIREGNFDKKTFLCNSQLSAF